MPYPGIPANMQMASQRTHRRQTGNAAIPQHRVIGQLRTDLTPGRPRAPMWRQTLPKLRESAV